MRKVVLFESGNRFDLFFDELRRYNVDVTTLSFEDSDWINFDFSDITLTLYYPTFQSSSNDPMALRWVKDNIAHLSRSYPNMQVFPDPRVIPYYCDKYRQYLFMRQNGLPIPKTIPIESEDDAIRAVNELGFPLVIKNRFGAGGANVKFIDSMPELSTILAYSKRMFGTFTGMVKGLSQVANRRYLRAMDPGRPSDYPFWSAPIIAQEYIWHDHDLKVVVGDGEPVEAHWRRGASASDKKMNIDAGGIGEWSFVPDDATNLCVNLAHKLGAKWLNIDLLPYNDGFLVSEFSPVWHHYKYQEKASFRYKDDYNLKRPIERYCDLERMICESYLGERNK